MGGKGGKWADTVLPAGSKEGAFVMGFGDWVGNRFLFFVFIEV